MTEKEIKQQVKELLKEAGFDTAPKAITIKVRIGKYADKIINIMLKSLLNDIKEVEDVAKQFESIEYDRNGCGDIMQGCNTFVNVSYDWKFYDAVIEGYKEQATHIIETTKSEGNNGKLIQEKNGRKMWYCKDLGICSFDGERHMASSVYELSECLFKFDKIQEVTK